MESRQLERFRILHNLVKNDIWDTDLMNQKEFKDFNKLNRKEKGITRMLCEGITVHELAKRLKVKTSTVNKYKSEIKYVYRKGRRRRIDDWVRREIYKAKLREANYKVDGKTKEDVKNEKHESQ